jgi:hypothetical protein
LALVAMLCCSQFALLWATLGQSRLAEPRLHDSTPVLKPGEKPRPRYWLNGQL